MKRLLKSAVRRLSDRVLGPAPKPATWAGYTSDALQLANIIDCLPSQLLEPQQHPERITAPVAERVCNWYLPAFDSPFYGGVMTILRLADFLQRRHGLRQRILICGGGVRAADVSASVARAFPGLASAEIIVLDSVAAIQGIPASDYSVATLWTTAYVLLGVQNTGLKFYMIQDFEPAFYPAGSTYAQAELSYRFGFYGICNTVTLKKIYEADYGGCAEVLRPSIDRTVFHPGPAPASSPRRLFYYARPGTPRNGFELAAAALTRLKQRFGDGLDIVCAGTGWNPSEFGLDGVVRSVGMLPYAATGDLYRSCHVGFVMMMTKHPSYLPFELMACGATVVTNYNDANTWLLKDGVNCLLSPPTASCLAATLAHALEQHETLAPLRARAIDSLAATVSDWDTSLESIAQFMLDPPADFAKRPPFGHSFLATQAT